MFNKITFLGGGSFGTSLGILLGNKGENVTIWDRNKNLVDGINKDHKNIKYIKDEILPLNLFATNSLKDALLGANIVIFSVPSVAVRDLALMAKEYLSKDAIIVNISKGIEDITYLRISEVLEEIYKENKVVILSGPSHAEEVVRKVPTVIVSSSKSIEASECIQELFTADYFRVYTNEDVIGVEIGGAVKNIIALAAGIIDGIGFGDNAKAALMTRGLTEIIRIGEALGANKETFSGLTGLGDLIVTCTSMNSRNRRAGILIGKGKKPEEAIEEIGMVVEGINACKAFYNLKEKLGVEMPITDALYKVIFQDENPKDAVYKLMIRDKKSEF